MWENNIHPEAINFEYIGSSNPSNAVVTVYKNGTVIDLTTLGSKGLAITDYTITTDADGVVTLFGGLTPTAGAYIFTGNIAALSGSSKSFFTPVFLPKATTLRVSGTGTVRVFGTGFIYKG